MSVDGTLTQGQNVGSLEKTRELSRGMLHAKGYELVSELGAGTYGVVWLAKDSRTGVMVAIKFFARGTGEQWESLQEEVKQLAQLHAAPNIVRLMDVESESWPPYFVMDYAEQGSLSARLRKGNIPVGEAVEMFRQIAQALAYVHAKGILHCDLKPGNILLDATGRAIVADFGQAHFASDTSPALGTFFYMAPEQADLSQSYPDTRWDVYAMGAILFAMLTGRPPREDSTLKLELENTAELSHRLLIYQQKVKSSAKPLGHRAISGVDRSLAEIVDRCLELDPEKRFRDAQAVLNAIRRRDRRKRQRSLVAFGMLVPVVLVLLSSLSSWMFTTRIVDNMQTALAQEIMKSVALQARPKAKEVSDFVKEYFNHQNELNDKISRDPEFLKLVKAGAESGWSDDRISRFMDERGKKLLEAGSGRKVIRWNFSDATGVMRGAAPYGPASLELIGKHYSWRDWFNGIGDKPNDGTRHAPIRQRHISQPFFGKSGFPTISISIPVWDGEQVGGAPLGVLAIAVKLEDFHNEIQRLEPSDGQIIVFNDKLRCMHRRPRGDLRNEKWFPQDSEKSVPTWDVPFLKESQKRDSQTTELGYEDPIDGTTYLAASVRIASLNWIVLVQRERESVMKIGEKLRGQARQMGLWGVAVACLLVPGAWGFLMWIIRREEQADG